MSETTTAAETPTHRLRPSEVLITLLVTLLAPMFVCATAGDIVLARLAALETINDYRARNHADLIAVAQIIGYGLAALGSLSLSMAGDASLSMTLRLRGNANACTRSAEHNRRAIRENREDPPIHESWFTPPEPGESEFGTFISPEVERLFAAESAARLREPPPTRPQAPTPATSTPAPTPLPTPLHMAAPTPAPKAAFEVPQAGELRTQATTLLKRALRIDAGIPHLPPVERTEAVHKVAELNSVANQLLAALDPPPPPFGDPKPPTTHR